MPADTGARTAVVARARLCSANLVLSSSRSNTPSVKVAISLAMAYAASTNSLSPVPSTSPRTWTANQRSKSRSVEWPLATLASRALRSRRMSTPDKPFDYLDPTVLRRLFNDQQIPEKAIAGDLREEIRPQTHLSAHRRARLTIRGRQAQACTHTCYRDIFGLVRQARRHLSLLLATRKVPHQARPKVDGHRWAHLSG